MIADLFTLDESGDVNGLHPVYLAAWSLRAADEIERVGWIQGEMWERSDSGPAYGCLEPCHEADCGRSHHDYHVVYAGGAVCALGGMHLAHGFRERVGSCQAHQFHRDLIDEASMELHRLIRPHYSQDVSHSIISFNDDEGRTADEVIEALRLAAARLEVQNPELFIRDDVLAANDRIDHDEIAMWTDLYAGADA